jgi:hypothetical protein
MFHVICESQNASHLINDVPFKDHESIKGDEGGWMSVITVEPVPAHIAGMFKGIPGYRIIDAKSAEPVKASEADAERDTRRGRGRPTNAELAARQAAAPVFEPVAAPVAEPVEDPGAAAPATGDDPVAHSDNPPAE